MDDDDDAENMPFKLGTPEHFLTWPPTPTGSTLVPTTTAGSGTPLLMPVLQSENVSLMLS